MTDSKPTRAMTWAAAASRRGDLGAALAECAARLQEQLPTSDDDEPVDLLVAFVGEAHRRHFAHMARLLQATVPHRHLIGCSAAGVLADGTEIEASPGVALSAALLPGVDIEPFHFERASLPEPDDVPAWEAAIGRSALDEPAFVLLTDPFSFDPRPLIAGLDRAWPHATKIGGLASAGQQAGQRNVLFLDDETLEAGAVGVALSGNIRLDAVVAQGCRPIGEPMFVTRSSGNILYELDGLPALDALTSLHQRLDRRDQAFFPDALFLGIAMQPERHGPGDFLVRNIVGAIPDAGAMVVAAELAEHHVVQFHVRDRITSATDLQTMLARHRTERPAPPRGALLFSCVGRGVHLYDEPDHDSRLFRENFGNVPLCGFFGNGELGPVHGRTWLHGYTSAFGLFRARHEDDPDESGS